MNTGHRYLLGALLTLPCIVSAEDIRRAPVAPLVDGNPTDAAWELANWRGMNEVMLGEVPSAEDFSGRYKLVWTASHLYLLAELNDDVLIDRFANPLEKYWESDTLEIFIDEDASGGPHEFSYNAFAYHIGLDNQAIDMAPYRSKADRDNGVVNVRAYPEHITSVWQRSSVPPYPIYWEVAISVFADDYVDPSGDTPSPSRPLTLEAGKTLGFMLAYCDADDGAGREHFVGDVAIEPVNGDKNLGYIDASVFGRIKLVE